MKAKRPSKAVLTQISTETLARIEASHGSPNGQGWLRLLSLFEAAAADPLVIASHGASEFIDVMCEVVGDAVSAQSAVEALSDLDKILPNGELGTKKRRNQALIAAKPRGLRTDDGKPVLKELAVMVCSTGNRELTVKQLWPQVFSVLDGLNLDPVERDDPDMPGNPIYEYGFSPARRKMRFTTFQGHVSKWRPKKKSG